MPDPSTHLWWQKGIIYQIYPRSFMDADGDGVGDLRGIQDRLDYLTWLGVDAIWISPIFPSPMADFGYDVADYCGIHPLFGTMEDFDRLLDAVHERGLKLLLDFVPNHTSDQHPWFQEARASRDNPKRDWYLWHDPAPGGGPPTNWRSVFGGPAWTLDEATNQYYYHAFLKEQPDLNWRNPAVQEAMLDVLRFWFDKGVDGFRIDVLWHIIKDDQYRDNPKNPDYEPGDLPYHELLAAYTTDQPEVHDIAARMREIADAYDERVLIGEIYLPIEQLVAYYGQNGEGVHLPFNFQLIQQPWDARELAALIDVYEGALPDEAWPNWVLGNHDKARIASRVGAEQARVAAMLLLTLRGTPTMYYGDELGMHDVEIPPDRAQDPQQKNLPHLSVNRDRVRTPMQWSTSPNAGFTTGTPWLPLADDYQARNVDTERADPTSMLSLYRRLIDLRREEQAFSAGSYAPVEAAGTVLAYRRQHGDRAWLVALNLGPAAQSLALDTWQGWIRLSTYLDQEGDAVSETLRLRADEGVIVELEAAGS